MFSKIFREPPADKQLHIDWLINTVCNYSCSYCPKTLHDGAIKTPNLNTVQSFIDQLKEHYPQSDIFINLLGGEPSYIKDLPDYLELFKSRDIKVQLITNLSRDFHWWEKNLSQINSMVATFHPESAEKKHFRDILTLCNEKNFPIKLKFLAPPGRVTEVIKAYQYVINNQESYHAWVEEVQDHTRSFINPEYTKKELTLISMMSGSKNFNFPLHHYFNDSVYLDQDDVQYLNSGKLMIEGKNNFKGWSCSAGLNSLAINAQGDIYRAWCQNLRAPTIGNIREEKINFPIQKIICPYSSCNCGFDILTPKEKVDQ